MMRTAIDQTTILFKVVDGSPLKTAITGSVYKDQKPANSLLEDIVVNSVTLSGSESLIQRGVANVNIHLPNLSNGLPNHVRIKQLEDIATPLLEDFTAEDHNFWTEIAGVLIRDESSGKWYLNYRLKFKFHNTNN
jgi:hypothetical protein